MIYSECKLGNRTIKGLLEIQPKVFSDKRGYIFESFNEKIFIASGLNMKFVQDNESKSCKGVLRGLHFQKKHPQGKLVRVVFGKVYDVVVDLRNGSETFGLHYGVVLDSDKKNQFYIPEGFAHGFYVLSDEAVFSYKCTDYYYPDDEGGIIWNDPTLNINWNILDKKIDPIISDKDKMYPPFCLNEKYFDVEAKWQGKQY